MGGEENVKTSRPTHDSSWMGRDVFLLQGQSANEEHIFHAILKGQAPQMVKLRRMG